MKFISRGRRWGLLKLIVRCCHAQVMNFRKRRIVRLFLYSTKKKSKKLFGLFAFLLVCANVNAGSVGAPQEYPHIRYNYDNVNASLPTFSFTENLTNVGNYIRVIENSKLDIASNLDINLTSNILHSLSPSVYGEVIGFGAYGTNNGAPTINAKDVKIKVEAGAADH